MEQGTNRTEQILLAEGSKEHREAALVALEQFFPHASVQGTSTWEASKSELEHKEFDIVVLDLDLAEGQPLLDLIFRLKTFDYEPSVVVVADHPPVHVLNDLYKFGCHRCIVKDERWIEELGTAIDYLMRIRKVTNENHVLRAKLTEANMMLQDKNQRLDEFSSTVAHDIRGPLGSVAMKLEYILDQKGDIDPERLRTLHESALGTTNRLVDLVQSMYDYAKLGARAAEMEDLNLEALITSVIEDLNFPEERDIEIGIGELPTVWGNENLLRRLFINLINNAVKYNDKEQVVINIGTAGIQKRMLAAVAEISVSDNGPGIPIDEQEDIFSLFRRGTTSHGDKDGSGVGLAVVKRIVELHSGAIQLISDGESGTKFLFTLPIERMSTL